MHFCYSIVFTNVDIPKQCLLFMSKIKEMPYYGIGNFVSFCNVMLSKASGVYSKAPTEMEKEKC